MRMPQVRFTIRRIMLIVAVVAMVLWVASLRVAICDGICMYSVQIHSTSGTPIQKVTCEAFGSEPDAAVSLERLLAPESKLWAAQVEPYTGQSLPLCLPFTFTVSGSGRVVSDVQYRALLAIVRFNDGRVMGKVAEIPHRLLTLAVCVEFP
jgi:hypothetical protein